MILLFFLVLGVGCASIANSDLVSVPVYTNPSGAKLVVAGRTYYSPDVVKVPRGHGDFVLVIEKNGFQQQRVLLKQSIDGFAGYNVLNAGVGVGDDLFTGRLYDLDPEIVRVQLVKENE